jgi:hypothetical protein
MSVDRLELVTICGYIPLSPQIVAELRETAIGPVHGPELPASLRLRRQLGGRPVGPYRRAS